MEGMDLPIIGVTEYVKIGGKTVPAKIDTGAETSSIWASDVKILPDKTLEFTLFDEKSDFYTGEKVRKSDYTVNIIRSSNGTEQIRYRIRLEVEIAGLAFETDFTLADRSKNQFPVLIGKIALENRFLIDPSKTAITLAKNPKTPVLRKEFKENPHEFHRKYLSGVETQSAKAPEDTAAAAENNGEKPPEPEPADKSTAGKLLTKKGE